MYKHPLTAIGALLVAYAVFTFLYHSGSDATERSIEYVGAYIGISLGAFCILIGIVVQGFRRLERLIIFRDIEIVDAEGVLGKIFDSDEVRKSHLKTEKR